MKTKNIAFTITLLLLSCVAFTFTAQADPPLPFHALLSTPPDPDRVAGMLETLLRVVAGNSNQFQLAGQVHLTTPPDPDMPYIFGEIVQYDGTVVTTIADPDMIGNETFFSVYALVSTDVAAQMTQTPTLFSALFYNDAGLVAQGTLRHAFSTIGDVIP